MAADALAAAASGNRHRESTLVEMPVGRTLVICIMVPILLVLLALNSLGKRVLKIKIIFKKTERI